MGANSWGDDRWWINQLWNDSWWVVIRSSKGYRWIDVATILARLNKWKSPYQLWLEKTSQIDLEHTESEPAYWNVLEEVVAKEFQERATGFADEIKYSSIRYIRFYERTSIVMLLGKWNVKQQMLSWWEGEEVPLSYLCQVNYMNV